MGGRLVGSGMWGWEGSGMASWLSRGVSEISWIFSRSGAVGGGSKSSVFWKRSTSKAINSGFVTNTQSH